MDGADFAGTFDHLAMHTPFSGLVRAAHRKLMRESGNGAAAIDADFEARVRPSLAHPSRALHGDLDPG